MAFGRRRDADSRFVFYCGCRRPPKTAALLMGMPILISSLPLAPDDGLPSLCSSWSRADPLSARVRSEVLDGPLGSSDAIGGKKLAKVCWTLCVCARTFHY